MSSVDHVIARMAHSAAVQLNGLLDPRTVRPLPNLSAGVRLADATSVYLIDGTAAKHDSLLIVSGEDYSASVKESSSAALRARTLLGDPLGQMVCVPSLADIWQGRSFAVYPRLEGFSRNRVLRLAQKRRVAPAVVDWLDGVVRQTGTDHSTPADLERRFHDPLQCLIDDDTLPLAVRSAARASLSAVEAGRVRTVTCLQHGDFWTGNIMFERFPVAGLGPVLRRFKVIDWGGSRADGYAGIDLLRFLLSAFTPGAQAARWLTQYGTRAGLNQASISAGCLSALGRLSRELNQFPRANFVALASAVVDFLARCGALDDMGSLDRAA